MYFLRHGVGGASPSLVLTQTVEVAPRLQSVYRTAETIGEHFARGDCRTRWLVPSACNAAAVAAKIMQTAGPGTCPTVIAMQLSWPIGSAFGFQREVLPDLLFRQGQSVAGAVSRWRTSPGITGSLCPRRDPVSGVPTVSAPIGARGDRAEVVAADAIPPSSALVATIDEQGVPCATRGPIGLSKVQRSLVSAAVSEFALQSLKVHIVQRLDEMRTAMPDDCEHEVAPVRIDQFPVTNHRFVEHEGQPWCQAELDAGRKPWKVALAARTAPNQRASPRGRGMIRPGDGRPPAHPEGVGARCARRFCGAPAVADRGSREAHNAAAELGDAGASPMHGKRMPA